MSRSSDDNGTPMAEVAIRCLGDEPGHGHSIILRITAEWEGTGEDVVLENPLSAHESRCLGIALMEAANTLDPPAPTTVH